MLNGIIQGISEALPISSSLHLRIFSMLGFRINCDSLGILHFGSFIGWCIFFYKDLIGWTYGFIKRDYDLFYKGYLVVILSVPAIIFGTILSVIKIPDSNTLFGISSIVFGGILAFSYWKISKPRIHIDNADLIVISLSQCLAFISGVSRLGITLTTIRLLRLHNKGYTKLCFLMGIPIMLGASVLELFKYGIPSGFVWNVISSAIFTYISLHFIFSAIRKEKFAMLMVFCGVYRVIVGGFLLGA
jgi:undecaprenyl-diphosphatase